MHFYDLLRELPAVLTAILVSILFVQSALDKVFDWKGNLGWLNGHFEKTPLAKAVPLLLAVITLMELSAGILAGVGVIYFAATGSMFLMFVASVVGALSIISLFFGQRIAKDYPGAAVLVPYFLTMILLMLLTNPYPPLSVR